MTSVCLLAQFRAAAFIRAQDFWISALCFLLYCVGLKHFFNVLQRGKKRSTRLELKSKALWPRKSPVLGSDSLGTSWFMIFHYLEPSRCSSKGIVIKIPALILEGTRRGTGRDVRFNQKCYHLWMLIRQLSGSWRGWHIWPHYLGGTWCWVPASGHRADDSEPWLLKACWEQNSRIQ